MGRGKVKMKRIEDKSNRQVSFTKRRNGLMKKSHELAVLCDVDVAAFVFSGSGRLYEFSTGESMTNILNRYESFKKMEELTRIHVSEKLATEYREVCPADELIKMIERHLEENNIKLLDTISLDQLEQNLGSFLQQVKIRKTQLKMGVVKALKDKETELKKEAQSMMEEMAAARMDGINDNSGDAVQRQVPTMDIHVTW